MSSWVENVYLFKDWVFYKIWRAANFHDFSLSVEATGQSLIGRCVGVIQDGGARVQGNTLREGAQPIQSNARVAKIIPHLYSIQSTVGDWWPANFFFQKYLGYFRYYVVIVVIGGPVIIFVVLFARLILGVLVWRTREEYGGGRVARAADYRVSPEPGKWKCDMRYINILQIYIYVICTCTDPIVLAVGLSQMCLGKY